MPYDLAYIWTVKYETTEDFLGVPVATSPPASAGDTGSVPGRGRSHVLWGS